MEKGVMSVAALALVLSACASGGGNTRTILVDYSSDRYANFTLYDFPGQIKVHPGTTLVFRQTWTGEPHTVTGGTAISGALRSAKTYIDLFTSSEALVANGAKIPDPESDEGNDMKFTEFVAGVKAGRPATQRDLVINTYKKLRAGGLKLPDFDNPPPDATFGEVNKVITEATDKFFESGQIPSTFPNDQSSTDLNQNFSQPCYLRSGMPSKDPKKPCTKAQQKQTEFDGKNSFYSSGIIRYEGANGNTFRIPLSKGIKPGKYEFYCAVHGPLQNVVVDVRPESEKIPSAAQATSEAQREIATHMRPLDKLYAEASQNKLTIEREGRKTTLTGPFAGLATPAEQHAAIADMLPKVFTAKAGAPIRWKMMGGQHTISFGVPPYFPPVEFLKDGTVRLNPKLTPPAGGAPKPPSNAPNGILKIDGGTYSGTGFWSSGFIGTDPYLEYTLRVAKPGRYRYACLLHPAMVGTLVVTP